MALSTSNPKPQTYNATPRLWICLTAMAYPQTGALIHSRQEGGGMRQAERHGCLLLYPHEVFRAGKIGSQESCPLNKAEHPQCTLQEPSVSEQWSWCLPRAASLSHVPREWKPVETTQANQGSLDPSLLCPCLLPTGICRGRAHCVPDTSRPMVLTQRQLCPPGDIWQHPETFLVVTTGMEREGCDRHLAGRGHRHS